MNLLTDEEISLMAHNEDEGDWNDLRFKDAWHEGYKAGAKAAQAALLAKLASAELPEPTVYSHNVQTHMNVLDAYSADQLRQAYAQGAAAQLAQEPILIIREQDSEIIPAGTKLYTRRQA